MRDLGLLSSAAWSVSLYREKPDRLEKPDRNKFKETGNVSSRFSRFHDFWAFTVVKIV